MLERIYGSVISCSHNCHVHRLGLEDRTYPTHSLRNNQLPFFRPGVPRHRLPSTRMMSVLVLQLVQDVLTHFPMLPSRLKLQLPHSVNYANSFHTQRNVPAQMQSRQQTAFNSSKVPCWMVYHKRGESISESLSSHQPDPAHSRIEATLNNPWLLLFYANHCGPFPVISLSSLRLIFCDIHYIFLP